MKASRLRILFLLELQEAPDTMAGDILIWCCDRTTGSLTLCTKKISAYFYFLDKASTRSSLITKILSSSAMKLSSERAKLSFGFRKS